MFKSGRKELELCYTFSMKKIAYVFRGSPASGKGTLTNAFIKLVPGKVAYLELDTFRWGFHLRNRTPQDFSEEEHQFAYENFLLMLENYCKNGNYTLVIEGLFSPHVKGAHGNMEDVVNILEKYGFEYKTILLSADYDTLMQRNRERAYVVPDDEFRNLYDYVMTGSVEGEYRIDVSGTIEETMERLKALRIQ